MKKLVQLKNKENENLDPINLNYEKRISNLEGTVLYESEVGTTKNITLNDDVSNYKSVKILFYDNQLLYNSADFLVQNGAWYSVQSYQYDSNTGQIILRGKNIQLNGKNVIVGGSGVLAHSVNGNALYFDDAIYIFKVVGYK